MSEILQRAKALQAKVTSETSFWVKLDLFEGLIAEIEALRKEVQRLQPATGRGSIRAIREGLEGKED